MKISQVTGYLPFFNGLGHMGIFFPLLAFIFASIFADTRGLRWEDDVPFINASRSEEAIMSEVRFKNDTTSGSKAEKLAPESERAVMASKKTVANAAPVMLLRVEVLD